MEFPKVIVVGSHHHNTLGVIRALGRKGITPFVIMTNVMTNSYILRSKYIVESVQLSGSDEVIPFLLEHVANRNQTPVIIACHDRISEILDFNRTALSKFFHTPGTPVRRLSALVNKESQTRLAAQIGLNVPFSVMSDFDLDFNGLHYPVITKPAASRDGSKNDIRILYTPKTLANFLQSRQNRKFQIQKYIDKVFEFQLIGCSIYSGDEIVIPGVSKLIRTGAGSNTGFLEYTSLTPDFDRTLALTKKFIRATGYSGLFSVEFLRGRDGIDYFMEMNFRNDGNAICTTNAGANLPYYWVQKCLGLEVETPTIDHTEYVMPEYNEIGFWLGGAISTHEFIKDLRKSTSYMEFASDDPGPTHNHRDFRIKLLKAAIIRPAYLIAKRLGLR